MIIDGIAASRSTSRLATVLAVLLTLVQPGLAPGGPRLARAEDPGKLLTEAKLGWAKLERASANVRMAGREVTRPVARPDAAVRVEERDLRFARKGDAMLMIRGRHRWDGEDVLGPHYVRVGCVSKPVCFVLDRSKPDHTYNILDVSGDDPALRDQLSAIMHKYLDAPWRVSGKSFADFASDPGFELREFRREMVAGKELAVMSFEFTPTKQPDSAIRGGTFWFDPSRSWANVRCESRTVWGTFRWEVAFRGETACPSRITDRLESPDGKGTSFEFSCESCSHGGVDDAEFTLEHFGLIRAPHAPPGPGVGPAS